MGQVRIIAHFMHEPERDAALAACDKAELQGRIVVGEIDEDDIPDLQEKGLFVQRVGTVAESRTVRGGGGGVGQGQSAPAPPPASNVLFGSRVRGSVAPVGPAPTPAPVDVYVVSLDGPLLERARDAVADLGVEILEKVEPFSYTVRAELGKVPALRALDFVSDVRLYGPADTVEPVQLSQHRGPGAPAEAVEFELLVHRADDLDEVRQWLAKRDIEVHGSARRKLRFESSPSSPDLVELARLPTVAALDRFVPPRFSNDHARRLVGIDGATAEGGLPQTGRNQIVAVADSGIDKDHPDLKRRIAATVALGRPPADASDPHGHGTHVAGTISGDGSASAGKVRGMAPEAKLYFQSIMDAGGGLGGLPPDLGDLFRQAYDEGARIHNNSWGAEARSVYRVNSLEVDEFVHTHPDMLVVIAAGNAGTAASPLHSQRGFVDLFSVDAPATAKNALTVGASRTDRRFDPARTWRQMFGSDFGDPPIAEEEVCGDPECMAAFSGRGPCHEQIRMKPDIVAPGTFILSSRSSIAPDDNFWLNFDTHYAYMGGTSMATPVVSGAAALVRQYFIEDRAHHPSAALLKATLVNGARWLAGPDAVADHPLEPNYHQGFGCLFLPWTIPNPSMPDLRLEFSDDWEAGSGLMTAGDSRQFVFTATGATWLRLALVWTDPPPRALQNNLNLLLEHGPSRRKWSGNQNRRTEFKSPDPGNNVQVVRIDAPPAGGYTVQVSATEVLRGPQPFALVVAGGVDSALAQI